MQNVIAQEQLSLLTIKYFDFTGNVNNGVMLVHHKIAEAVQIIFRQLFELKFPIEQMRLSDAFDNDDILMMEANNSSCFNHRPILGTDLLSMHSYGLAIDLNPRQNPYLVIDEKIGAIEVFPKTATHYLNRNNIRPGMVEPIVYLFKEHNFVWGGDWNKPIDYHHFQIDRMQLKRYI